MGIHQGRADDSILDRYSEVRRQKYLDIIDPVSSSNIRRLFQDTEAIESDEFFAMLRNAKDDPALSAKLNEVSGDTSTGFFMNRSDNHL